MLMMCISDQLRQSPVILNLKGIGFSYLAVRCTEIHRQAVNCLYLSLKAVLSSSTSLPSHQVLY